MEADTSSFAATRTGGSMMHTVLRLAAAAALLAHGLLHVATLDAAVPVGRDDIWVDALLPGGTAWAVTDLMAPFSAAAFVAAAVAVIVGRWPRAEALLVLLAGLWSLSTFVIAA